MWQVVRWAWENRAEIEKKLAKLWSWYHKELETGDGRGPSILVIGAGGVGKTTLGNLLAGQFDLLTPPPEEYRESLNVETVALDSGEAEVAVLPGQDHRRGATWAELLGRLSAGEFRGVVLVSAFGYHSLGDISYKNHPFYERDKQGFLETYLANRRAEELSILRRMTTHAPASGRRLWFLSLIVKQDLWSGAEGQVKDFYEQGEYGAAVRSMSAALGEQNFRHEYAYASLVISNFKTGWGELLAKNAAGFDHHRYARSLRSLIETLDSLREWET